MVGDPSRPSSPPGAPGAPEATAVRRVLLGELLVESKVITAEQLGEVLGSPREAGKKLGQVLLERGWITEAQLTQTLSLQLSVPWVSLYHIDFSRQLLNRLSREVAEKYCLIPIFVRHVKGQGETLYVAMDDPTNEGALQEVSRLAGLPTRPMIASASDIRSAIRVYYGEPTSSAPVLEVPVAQARAAPPMSARDAAPVTPPIRLSTSCAERPPLRCAASKIASRAAMPRARLDTSRSTRTMGRSALRNAAAMPTPMVPPPTTPTRPMALGATPRRSGGRKAARSAKKR